MATFSANFSAFRGFLGRQHRFKASKPSFAPPQLDKDKDVERPL
jgi:hypothetical protein